MIATVFLRHPERKQWGYDLVRATGVRSGIVYPILKRWFEMGWLEDGWEDPMAVEGRPPRRYFTITETGILELPNVLATFDNRRRPTGAIRRTDRTTDRPVR